ncbi:MAG TPA: hypothetical protein PKO09_12495 [Anaerolineae bacterium]|nr:hypothetical protein [Anaerolineae bacterium]
MSGENLAADTIEVTIDGVFTTHHTFRAESSVLGELTVPAFSRDATFQAVDGQALTVHSTSWRGSRYELCAGEDVLAATKPRGAFRQPIDIEHRGGLYSAVPAGAFRQGWFLVDAAGSEILSYQPRGAFRRGAYLEVLDTAQMELIVLFYYLVFQRKREEAAATGAGASN